MVSCILPNIAMNPPNLSSANRFEFFVDHELTKSITPTKDQEVPENVFKRNSKKLQKAIAKQASSAIPVLITITTKLSNLIESASKQSVQIPECIFQKLMNWICNLE